MRNFFFSFSFLLAFCLLLSSCEEKLNVKTFEPLLEIQGKTDEIVSGEDFYFRVYSETGKFIINAIEIRDDNGGLAYSPDRATNSFPLRGISIGQEVLCDGTGWARFEAPSVYVEQPTVYTLTMTLTEPSTSNTVKLTGKFKGRVSLGDGEMTVSGFSKTASNGDTVSDGNELKVTMKFLKPSFILKKYHVPQGCSVVEEGNYPVVNREYNLPEDCMWRFSIKCNGILNDSTDSLCFDVMDKDSGKTMHIRYKKNILCRYKFKYSIKCSNVNSDDGNLALTITTNRSTFTPKVLEVKADYENDLYCNNQTLSNVVNRSFTDFFRATYRNDPNLQLDLGTVCDFGEDDINNKTLCFDAKNVSSVKDQTVYLRFRLEDQATGTELEETCEFTVFTSNVPTDMEVFYIDDNGNEVSLGRCKSNEGSVVPLYVGYCDDSPVGQERGVKELRFRFLSGKGSIIKSVHEYEASVNQPTTSKLSVSGDAIGGWGTKISGVTQDKTGTGILFLKGGSAPGEKKVTVSVNDTHSGGRMEFSFPVYVSRRCAIIIDGDIINHMHEWSNDTGWKGLVDNTTFSAKVFEYGSSATGDKDPLYAYIKSHDRNLVCIDIENYVNFNPLPGQGTDGDVDFIAEMKWTPGHASPCFYGALEKNPGRLQVKWWPDDSGGGWHWWFPYAGDQSTWPKTEGTGKSAKFSFTANNGVADMKEMADIINYYCDNCIVDTYHKDSHESYDDFYTNEYYSALKPTGKMSFTTRDVTWTSETIDIRYVVYRFKNNTNYWWHEFDEGVWYQQVGL